MSQHLDMAQYGIEERDGEIVLVGRSHSRGTDDTSVYHIPDENNEPLCNINHGGVRRVLRNTVPWYRLCQKCEERQQ